LMDGNFKGWFVHKGFARPREWISAIITRVGLLLWEECPYKGWAHPLPTFALSPGMMQQGGTTRYQHLDIWLPRLQNTEKFLFFINDPVCGFAS
jgi:hypothetical protein